jgi:hypothetical protein
MPNAVVDGRRAPSHHHDVIVFVGAAQRRPGPPTTAISCQGVVEWRSQRNRSRASSHAAQRRRRARAGRAPTPETKPPPRLSARHWPTWTLPPLRRPDCYGRERRASREDWMVATIVVRTRDSDEGRFGRDTQTHPSPGSNARDAARRRRSRMSCGAGRHSHARPRREVVAGDSGSPNMTP